MSKDRTIACSSTLYRLTTLGFNNDEAEDQDPKTYNKRKTILRKTMEDSQFYHLLMIKNYRQTAATVVQVFCESYNAEKRVFNINNSTTIKFCAEEVAELLGIPNTGSDPVSLCRFSKEKEVLKLPTSFLDFVYELKNKYTDKLMSTEKSSKSDAGKWGVNWERSKRHLSTASLVTILKKMEPTNTESRMQYRSLLSYYLVETFLLPSTDDQYCRTSSYKYVEDLERFEATNWAKATLDGVHEAACKIKNGLSTFTGCTPVFEALIFERISSLRPKVRQDQNECLPIEKYLGKKISIDEVKKILGELTPNDIKSCQFCDGSVELRNHNQSKGESSQPNLVNHANRVTRSTTLKRNCTQFESDHLQSSRKEFVRKCKSKPESASNTKSAKTPSLNTSASPVNNHEQNPQFQQETQDGTCNIFTVKAEYKEDIIKFDFSSTSNFAQLKEEVGKRFNLDPSGVKIKYHDNDGDYVLITGDTDLQYFIHNSGPSKGKPVRLTNCAATYKLPSKYL